MYGILQNSRLRLALVTVAGILLLGACNGFKSSPPTDDKAITTGIQAKLFNDPGLKTRDIHVDTRNGVVTLSGNVDTDLEKSAAERLATQEEGVKKVDDALAVISQFSAPAPQPTQKAESVEPPPPAPHVARHAAPAQTQSAAAEPAPEKPQPTESSAPPSPQDKAAAELQAYTNSVAPAASANATPVPGAPAPATAAQSQVAAAPVALPPPAPPVAAAPKPKPAEHVTVAAGTVVTIRMIDNIDSSRNQPGEEFVASVDAPIVVGDRVLAARGADARVRLVDAKSAGHIEGQSELQLELINVTMNGTPYATHSGYYEQHGASRGTRSAETIGGGAVLGAVLGGIFGRGRGAAIGSIAGAGAGTAVQVSTKGQQVKVPSETKLDFTLKDPVDVTISGGQ